MQKNWYMVYTKPNLEKKVAASIKKRKIESFLPLNKTQIPSFRKISTSYKILFPTLVFVRLGENEIAHIKSIDGVINLIYWKGAPATVQDEEIEVIKEFTESYQDIEVERSKVNLNEEARIIGGAIHSISGNTLTIKNTKVKVNLSSIGFTLVASISPEEETYNKEVSFAQNHPLLQS